MSASSHNKTSSIVHNFCNPVFSRKLALGSALSHDSLNKAYATNFLLEFYLHL